MLEVIRKVEARDAIELAKREMHGCAVYERIQALP
ncbi:hypothetical protein [Aquabacter sediminis]